MITLLINIVRIVVVLLAVRFVLRFVAAVIEGYSGGGRRGGGPTREVVATDMVRDRVCDTFVPRARALVAVVNGQEQHFCSPACRERARELAAQ